jgi:hypothetical protein
MTAKISNSNPKRVLSARFAAGVAISALLALGALATPANADWDNNHHGGYHHNWNGGYYRSPPVVYGSPYGGGYYGSPYYSPPVVYGPSVGINLGGVGIGIR